jgi:hypothetical protein
VTTVLLPYDQVDRVAADSIQLPDQLAASEVAPELPDGDVWQRLVRLYNALATAVASSIDHGEPAKW